MRALPSACTSLARPSIVSANAVMTLGRKAPIRRSRTTSSSSPSPTRRGSATPPTRAGTREAGPPQLAHLSVPLLVRGVLQQRERPFGVLRVMNDDLVMPKRASASTATPTWRSARTSSRARRRAWSPEMGNVRDAHQGCDPVHDREGRAAREHNLDGSKPLRFIQMWITPNAGGLARPTTARTRSRGTTG